MLELTGVDAWVMLIEAFATGVLVGMFLVYYLLTKAIKKVEEK